LDQEARARGTSVYLPDRVIPMIPEIVEVLERRTTRFVGSYFERAGVGWVQVDGTSFTRPVAVGDPGAKGVHVDDKVVVELVRFPTHLRDGEGVVVEVLGKAGDVGVDTQTVIHEYGLPGAFPEAALDDARRQAAQFDETVPAGRRDLCDRTIITIDPVDARDFDDAISLEQVERGHWLLGVHIADVSHFVREGAPLDQEARARGTSVYLPDRVIPMIPEIVSNNLASLQPNKVRYAKTCWIEFTADGVPVHSAVEPSAIKSCRRFTYEEVDVFLADPETRSVEMAPGVRALLGRMRDLARMLRRRRMARGALQLEMPEVKIDLDRDGRVTGAHVVEHTESHQIIEEFMLSANEAVAGALAAAGAGFLRRIHPSPDMRKLRQLTEFVTELGFEVDSLESRFEITRCSAA
ncbi:MAG: RNB domain-containing ribonuclease, partial [Planctomycetia bacterium]|nr:RNB domain-containing ribonuclease [Planctomycetia bacterium]